MLRSGIGFFTLQASFSRLSRFVPTAENDFCFSLSFFLCVHKSVNVTSKTERASHPGFVPDNRKKRKDSKAILSRIFALLALVAQRFQARACRTGKKRNVKEQREMKLKEETPQEEIENKEKVQHVSLLSNFRTLNYEYTRHFSCLVYQDQLLSMLQTIFHRISLLTFPPVPFSSLAFFPLFCFSLDEAG